MAAPGAARAVLSVTDRFPTLVAALLLLGLGARVGAQQPCEPREAGSRWVSQAARAVQTDVYGSGDTWIATFAGLAAATGRIFLFDEGRPVVSQLTATLNPVREFGRAGSGPGEISGGMNLRLLVHGANHNFLAADGNTIALYDRSEIEVFDSLGTPRYSVRLPLSGPWMYGLRHLAPLGESTVLAIIDSVDVTGRRPRRLQAWIIQGSGRSEARTLLWELPVPGDTGTGLMQMNRRVSRPYWSRIPGCQVASDGTSRSLVRYDEYTREIHTLSLPDWPIADWGRARGDGSGLRMGGRRITEQRRPAALARWSDLIMDPDGWVWVRGWTEDPSELRVFAVSAGSGRVVDVTTPAFPQAFGEPGVFYGIMRNRETDEVLLLRYQGNGQ